MQPTCLQIQLPLEGPTLRSRWTRACLLARKIIRDGSYHHNGYSEGFAGKHASVMYTVPDRRAATLLPIIQGSIRPGTTIMSDMWAAYGGKQAMGYAHLTEPYLRICGPYTGAFASGYGTHKTWKTHGKMRSRMRNGTHHSMLDSYIWKHRVDMAPTK